MSLRTQIQDDIKAAMRARAQEKLATLRMLSAAIKQKEVDQRIELDDTQILPIVEKLIKQRREAAEQFEQAERMELADQERAEAEILAVYLPAQLDAAALDALIDEAVAAAGASGPQDMGKVMGQLKPRVQGQADMGEVSRRVKDRLTQG